MIRKFLGLMLLAGWVHGFSFTPYLGNNGTISSGTITNFIASTATISNVVITSGAISGVRLTSSSGTITNLTVSTESVRNVLSIGTNTANPETTNFLLFETPNPYIAYTIPNKLSGNTTQDYKGYSDYNTIIATTNASYQGVNIRAATAGTANFDAIYGLTSGVGHYSSGTMNGLYGLFVNGFEAGGQLSNYFGAYIEQPTVISGTIVNNYGVYVLPLANATGKNYAVFTEGATQSIFTGGMGTGSYTAAQIKAIVPQNVGLLEYCNNCATVAYCVSTGTLVNQWALITNKGSACQ